VTATFHAPPVERIRAQAKAQVDQYIRDRATGQTTSREIKEVIESIISTDYDGRTVVELMQNAHDAHPKERVDGVILIDLREEADADHGVLYVANAGNPIRAENFDSLCRLGMSTKRPDEGIGNKGVGFKSVIQLCDSPEIYSVADLESPTFDGYCFRFALPSDFDELAARYGPGAEDFADELRENVAGLRVPIALGEVPSHADALRRAGFVTVIRLELRSAEAQGRALEQIKGLLDVDVPPHLFLSRVKRTEVQYVAAGDERSAKLARTVTRRESRGRIPMEEVHLQDGEVFHVLHRPVPESMVRAAISESIDAGRLGRAWASWRGDAVVSVALPAGPPLDEGRLYTFLPMGVGAAAPLAAYVHAPFFARLDRQTLKPGVPLNRLLLDQVAELCADAASDTGNGPSLTVRQRLDLVCWTSAEVARLIAAFTERGVDIADLPIVPTVPEATTSVSCAVLWRRGGSAFTPAAVAQAGADGIVDPRLHDVRIARLISLAGALGLELAASDEDIASFAELYAGDLATREFNGEAWVQFFDDLASVVRDGATLSGRRILVDENGDLLAAGGLRRDPAVFAPGQEEDTPVVAPPAVVRDRVVFTHPNLPRREGPGGPLRPGWTFLVAQGLVREYATRPVMTLVGEIMNALQETDEPGRSECLRFAFDVWRGAQRELGAQAMARTGLLVPTISGWRNPSRAFFGTGWDGPSADIDQELVDLLAMGRETSADLEDLAGHLLNMPAAVFDTPLVPVDDQRVFLETLGVRHGLHPRRLPAARFRMRGEQVATPVSAGDLVTGMPRGELHKWVKFAQDSPRTVPSQSTTQYTPSADVAMLPGQFDWPAFDEELRRAYSHLALRCIGGWPDDAFNVTFGRSTDSAVGKWPSPLTWFLTANAWLPQTVPGRRSDAFLAEPRRTWWIEEVETPDFLPAQPAGLRRDADRQMLDRLKSFGVRIWDDDDSAEARAKELPDLVGTVVGTAGEQALRKAYEQALGEVVEQSIAPPTTVLASRHGRLIATNLREDGETVYVADVAGAEQERLIRQTSLLTLPLRDRRLAESVAAALMADGVTRLRLASTADIEVVADGVRARTAPAKPLDHLGGTWLIRLVQALLEHEDRGFPPITQSMIGKAARELGGVEIVQARRVGVSIDGHAVPETSTGAGLVVVAEVSRIVVQVPVQADRWQVLEAASGPIMELSGRSAMSMHLRIRLIDLQRRCGAIAPTLTDVAAVLGLRVEEITSLGEGVGDVSDVVPVLALVDLDLAEALRDAGRELASREELVVWVRGRLRDTSLDADLILRLADGNDLRAAADGLGVALKDANSSLRALGLQPIHNENGHRREMAAYVSQRTPEIQNQLRDHFVTAARRGDDLQAYVGARELPEIPPDPAWLEEYWELAPEVMRSRVESWIRSVAPNDPPVRGLPDVGALRSRGQRTIQSTIGAVRPLVEAWLLRHRAGEGDRPGGTSDIAASVTQQGLLDFGDFQSRDVVDWLAGNGHWPEGMTLTTSREALGLTEEEVERGRQLVKDSQENARRHEVSVQFKDRTYSDDPLDLRLLYEALKDDADEHPLKTDMTPVQLEEVEAVEEGDRDGHRRRRRGTSARAPREEKTKAVGLAGEVFVGAWLQRETGLAPEVTWRSGYRNDVLADGLGDDGLGYDFIVERGTSRVLVEAKSTTGDALEFMLAESEVRRAQDLAPDEEYLIVLVTHVLDPAMRGSVVLPNPFGPGGLKRYRVAGRSMRLQFQNPDGE